MSKNILIVTTNYSGCSYKDNPCPTLKETGVYLEEFAIPYLIFEKTGYKITLASLKGGLSPVDESSMSCSNPQEWDRCIILLRNTKKLSEIALDEFDAIYFPGGHGPLYDMADSEEIKKTVEYFYQNNKIISAICHGVIALTNAKDEKGEYILKNKKVTSFTNREEKIVKLDDIIPISVENRLKEIGAQFVEKKPWQEHAEADNNIITAQNQNSATLIAEKIVEKLN